MVSPKVLTGIKALDQGYPGWEDAIDLTILDLGDAQRCIVGQMRGDFAFGIQEILDGFGIATQFRGQAMGLASDYGLAISPAVSDAIRDQYQVEAGYNWDEYDREISALYAKLTKDWRTVIAARQIGL